MPFNPEIQAPGNVARMSEILKNAKMTIILCLIFFSCTQVVVVVVLRHLNSLLGLSWMVTHVFDYYSYNSENTPSTFEML